VSCQSHLWVSVVVTYRIVGLSALCEREVLQLLGDIAAGTGEFSDDFGRAVNTSWQVGFAALVIDSVDVFVSLSLGEAGDEASLVAVDAFNSETEASSA
jgi:hypothetical protein